MAEDNKSMFILISIVAIVAVVGLVVLILGGDKTQYVPVAQEASVVEGIGEEVDLAGEAKQQPPPSKKCSETDGGNVYNVKGTAQGVHYFGRRYMTITDSCNGNNVVIQNNVKSCNGIGMDCFLVESYCYGGYLEDKRVYCPAGCRDGACLPYTQKADCVDKEGKEDIYTRGYVVHKEKYPTYEQYEASVDNCFDDEVLMEYSCDGSMVNFDVISCQYGCFNGACKKK